MKKLIGLLVLVALGLQACATDVSDKNAATRTKIKEIDEKLALSPDNNELLWNRASASYQLGKETGEMRHFKEASELLEKLHQQVPNNQKVIYSLFETYANMTYLGEFSSHDNAKKFFNLLNKEIRSQSIPPSMSLLYGRIEKPYLLNDQNKSDEKLTAEYIAILKDAIKEQPKYLHAYSSLASLYSEQGNKTLAIAIAKQALNQSPENAGLLNTIGEIHMDYASRNGCGYDHSDDVKQAISYSRKALKTNPKDFRIHANLSRAYEMNRQVKLSINEARLAYKLKPDVDTKRTLALLLTMYGSAEDAGKILIEEVAKQNAELDYVRSVFYMKQGDFLNAYKNMPLSRYSDTYEYLTRGLAVEQLGKRKGIKYHAKKALKQAQPDIWQTSLLNFVLGEVSYHKLIETAKTSCHKAEANFYRGYLGVLAGNKGDAKKIFEDIIDTKLYGSYEHMMSTYFLSVL